MVLVNSIVMKIMQFLFIVTLFVFFGCQYNDQKMQDYYKKQDYKSVVIKKYQDWNNHGMEKIIIYNYNKDTVEVCLANWRYDRIFDYVQVGDSIIKPLNYLALTVKREGNVPRKFRYQDVGITL